MGRPKNKKDRPMSPDKNPRKNGGEKPSIRLIFSEQNHALIRRASCHLDVIPSSFAHMAVMTMVLDVLERFEGGRA